MLEGDSFSVDIRNFRVATVPVLAVHLMKTIMIGAEIAC